MKKKVILGTILFLTAAVTLGGCGTASDSSAASATPSASATDSALGEGEEATSDPNITINKDKKEVTVLAEVNGKYFTEPTRHGVVFEDGSNGDKSVLRGLGDEKVFHDALVAVGFVPGNNLTLDDMTKGVKVEGDPLDVYVSWDGTEVALADAVRASEERPMDIRFGGNLETAKEVNTGCILCFDSCAAGITSNSAYETGASGTIEFFGKDDVLPEDGTQVKVIFRARP